MTPDDDDDNDDDNHHDYIAIKNERNVVHRLTGLLMSCHCVVQHCAAGNILQKGYSPSPPKENQAPEFDLGSCINGDC